MVRSCCVIPPPFWTINFYYICKITRIHYLCLAANTAAASRCIHFYMIHILNFTQNVCIKVKKYNKICYMRSNNVRKVTGERKYTKIVLTTRKFHKVFESTKSYNCVQKETIIEVESINMILLKINLNYFRSNPDLRHKCNF